MAKRTSVSPANAGVVTELSAEILLPDEDVIRDTPEQQKLDQRIIRGRFHFYERPGGFHQFLYRRYKGEPITSVTLRDGGTYDLPYGIVRALEESAFYMRHNVETSAEASDSLVVAGGEQQVYSTGRGHARFAFMPVV